MSDKPSQHPYLRRVFDGRIHELKDGHSLIGRSDDCTIMLDDEPGLSRKHARITVDQESIILFDLGSLNGTLVNGKEAVNKLLLQHGDIIIFDEIEYELMLPESALHQLIPDSEKDTVVANLREREREDLIKSEVRLVDEAFLQRTGSNSAASEPSKLSSISPDPEDLNDQDMDSSNSVLDSIHQPTFIIRGAATTGVRIPLDTRQTDWTIGSAFNQDVSIDHPSIAERHATLSVNAGTWTLTDRGTLNGILVNGLPIEHQTITSGDVIRIGEIECLFVCPREFSLAPASPEETPEHSFKPTDNQTFDTSDMTPVGWRDSRSRAPKWQTGMLKLAVVLGGLAAMIAAYLYLHRH